MINQIYSMLDCQNDIEVQIMGVKLAENIMEVGVFILPMHPIYNKNIWENCARIICKRSDNELINYMSSLLEWLQDLNWPGALLIMERLKIFSGDLLLKPYTYAISLAMNCPEAEQEWLDNLTGLLDNDKLVENMDKELYSFLKKRYEEFWMK